MVTPTTVIIRNKADIKIEELEYDVPTDRRTVHFDRYFGICFFDFFTPCAKLLYV